VGGGRLAVVTPRDLYSAPAVFRLQVRGAHLPEPEPEFRFSEDRFWAFDYAWPDRKLAVEIEGGISDHRRGRHIRAQGFQYDLDKYNTAVLLGWRLLRFSTRDIQEGRAIDFVRQAFQKEPSP
jgi:hypothetical protein